MQTVHSYLYASIAIHDMTRMISQVTYFYKRDKEKRSEQAKKRSKEIMIKFG